MEDAQRVVANRDIVAQARKTISTLEPRYENVPDIYGEPSAVRAGFQGAGQTMREVWHELLGDRLQVDTALRPEGVRVPVQSRISSARAISKMEPGEMQARSLRYDAKIEEIKAAVRAQGGRPTDDQLQGMSALVEAREATTGIRRVYAGKGSDAGPVGAEGAVSSGRGLTGSPRASKPPVPSRRT